MAPILRPSVEYFSYLRPSSMLAWLGRGWCVHPCSEAIVRARHSKRIIKSKSVRSFHNCGWKIWKDRTLLEVSTYPISTRSETNTKWLLKIQDCMLSETTCNPAGNRFPRTPFFIRYHWVISYLSWYPKRDLITKIYTMQDVITFVDFQTVWVAGFEDPTLTNNLKALCLYNDRVILNVDKKMCEIIIEHLDQNHRKGPSH